MQRLNIEIFADYFQFYIQDDDDQFGDLPDAWTDEAVENLLAVSDHCIGVGTARNMDVPVSIEISNCLPDLLDKDWDRINAASIACDTGRLVVAGCTDYFPDALRIRVDPGTYDMLIAYRHLEKISIDGLEGDDSYHLYLAPIANQ